MERKDSSFPLVCQQQKAFIQSCLTARSLYLFIIYLFITVILFVMKETLKETGI